MIRPNPKRKPQRIDRKTAAGKKAYKELLSAVWGRDRGECQICGRNTVVPDYHHVVFRSQGGSDTLENMLILCHGCHHIIHAGNHGSAEYRQKAIDRLEEINEK